MAMFAELTKTNGGMIWVNLDTVRTMVRLPAHEGDLQSYRDENNEWREHRIGVRPARTRLTFGTTTDGDDDFTDVLEFHAEIMAAARRAAVGGQS